MESHIKPECQVCFLIQLLEVDDVDFILILMDKIMYFAIFVIDCALPNKEDAAVSCISDNNQSAEMTECLTQMNGMPSLVQECTIPCREDCTFTPWSKFTPCSKNCEATQIRRRQLTGKSRKKEKCQDATLYPLVEMEPCPCDAFMSHPYGNWSACILPENQRDPQRGGLWVSGADKECGKGVRYRAIACSDKNGRPVDPSFCNSTEFDKHAICVCIQVVNQNVEQRDLVFFISIQVVNFWAMVFGTLGKDDNGGERLKVSSKDASLLGKNLFCIRKGYVQEECVVPCPFDCKLSDWSSWGSCSSSCGIGVRIRSKWLKEKPYSGGRPCPKLDLKNQ
ncbi:hypothetical protein STEG23_033909, partial [Scotinomys teguina]